MTAGQIIRAGQGLVLGPPAGCRDRFLIDSEHTGGRFSLVEHLLAPRSIAAPMHVHGREDEFSFVLEGRVSVRLGEDEHVAEVGDLVFKPRGQWHTFWNAEDEPARLLELISPGGLEAMFRAIDTATDETDIGALISATGCEGDPVATEPIVERYGLTWG
jgi:mannose-6-phosphate isomerase-like protein (cupin superfamily)